MLINRDESALAEVREKYGGLCYSVACNVLHSEEDIEECLNDLYINLWSAIPPANPSNLKAYVCKITRNLSLLRLRYNEAGKRDVRLTVSLSELEENLLDSGSDPVGESVKGEAEYGRAGRLISDFLRRQKPPAAGGFYKTVLVYGFGQEDRRGLFFQRKQGEIHAFTYTQQIKKIFEKGRY